MRTQEPQHEDATGDTANVGNIKITADDIVRFISYCTPTNDGCWLWNGARSRGRGNKQWYGSFRVGKKVWRSHAFSMYIKTGRLAKKGEHRDHVCGNSSCVSPHHLVYVPRVVNQNNKTDQAFYVVRKVWKEEAVNLLNFLAIHNNLVAVNSPHEQSKRKKRKKRKSKTTSKGL